jgi:hypothetical protein
MKNVYSVAGVLLLLVGPVACSGGGAGVSTTPNQPGLTTSSLGAPSSVGSSLPASAQVETAAALQSTALSATAVSSITAVAINAGGAAVGGAWAGDTDYAAGWSATSAVANAIDTSRASSPAPQSVYQNQRWGVNLTYTVPNLSANGAYTVRLHFVESFFNAAGRRVFNVNVNGSQKLSNFDVFAAAGAENRAVVEQFAVNANSSGQIIIQLIPGVNYPSIAGVEIVGGTSSSTPAPSPSSAPVPVPAPSSAPIAIGGNSLPWVYSELWSSASPFKSTVATQRAKGASVVGHAYMDSLWNQGIAGNALAQSIPIYTAKSSDPLLTASCSMYGGNCNASGVRVHVPSYATAQQTSDKHIVIVDPNAPGGGTEVDCWQASVWNSTFSCSWAGAFALGGTALSVNGNSGIHGGMAVTSVYITGQELADGHIDHALGLTVRCLNNPTVYPGNVASGTDTACDGSSNPPHYGNLVHLLWSSSQIAASSYSAPCKVVLTALATYGAYLDDTGDTGLEINTQDELSYTANSQTASLDPWPSIQSKLNASGDGIYHAWSSCLNRLHSSDFELLQIAKG